jgi:hypothetical protein
LCGGVHVWRGLCGLTLRGVHSSVLRCTTLAPGVILTSAASVAEVESTAKKRFVKIYGRKFGDEA